MPTKTPTLAQEVIAEDEGTVAAEFIAFLKAASARRHPTGVMPRFNQGRHSGCVDATFNVQTSLPEHLRVGLFAQPRSYHARIRFANAASATDREKDLRGMSIRVLDVPGQNLTPGASTQDFILNSHPVMMVGTTREFLELLQAVEAGGIRRILFFMSHPGAARVALAARTNPTSHLDISYWSTTPYLFGPGRAVKYIARPRARVTATLPDPLTDNYLREALASRLSAGESEFDLMVQFQTDPMKMPLEDASVEWNEQDSPYLPVSRIVIAKQRLDDVQRARFCEEVAFNPWHCLPEHRPLGNFNRARRSIYEAMAALRRERAQVVAPARV